MQPFFIGFRPLVAGNSYKSFPFNDFPASLFQKSGAYQDPDVSGYSVPPESSCVRCWVSGCEMKRYLKPEFPNVLLKHRKYALDLRHCARQDSLNKGNMMG